MYALSFILAAATVGILAEDAPTTDQVRAAVDRSIPYIQEKGALWIEEKKCVSCHRVNTMVWSLSMARKNGFEVSGQLDEWLKWSIDNSLSRNDKGEASGLGNKEGVAQILLSLGLAEDNIDQRMTRTKLLALLKEGQQPNGSWSAGGQLPSQKRPRPETATVSTMWLALGLIGDVSNDETKSVVQHAMNYIENSRPGKSTEWYAVRMLLAARGDDRENRDRFTKELFKQQNPDGGWGWLVGDKSDALGTGTALYALLATELDQADANIKRAQQFLVTTQRDDGSWEVQGTKANNKDSVQETAVYWGTTWAAMGLMAGLSSP